MTSSTPVTAVAADRRQDSSSRCASASKPVGNGNASVRRYAHAYDFLEVGLVKVFGCLATVAARDAEIQVGIQPAMQKGPNYRAAKFFHRRAGAFRVEVYGIASGPQRLGGHI